MELGQIVFGNPVGGIHQVNRDKFEEIFFKLTECICKRTGLNYYEDFRNDVFRIKGYRWNAICDCGFEELSEKWHKTNKHSSTCDIVTGKSTKCNCGFEQEVEKFYNENWHSDECELGGPNFIHIPSGYKIWWYKYPLRSAYANKKISEKQFEKIIDECINSVKFQKDLAQPENEYYCCLCGIWFPVPQEKFGQIQRCVSCGNLISLTWEREIDAYGNQVRSYRLVDADDIYNDYDSTMDDNNK